MNYKEKFYDKFGKNNFIFIDTIRDKKRTFLKIKCNKCDTEEIKEQFNLFKKDHIFCHKCNNRKKSSNLNIKEEISKIENDLNIKIKNYIKEKNIIFFFYDCKNCGIEIKKSLYEFTRKNFKLKFADCCYSCSQKKRKWKNQHTTESVKEWFLSKGIEPLFDEYKNSYTMLDLKCICGKSFKMTFKNRFNHINDSNWIPKCQDCLDIDRLNNFNYTYNRYDTRKKDRYWSLKIRKKFNNKCIISEEIDNIVAHHLNGYNSYPEQKYDINNGVALSNSLHNEFHIKYDKFKGDCTLQQFEEFYEIKTQKKFNIKDYES